MSQCVDQIMTKKHLSTKIRQMAELQYAEIVGRLYACERLESEIQNISDPRVLYGWNLLTQEVLIRLAEASLKLLYMVHFDHEPPRGRNGHDLAFLWGEFPKEVRDEVEAKRQNYSGVDRRISFPDYSFDDFQDVRYSYERLLGGQAKTFETQRLYLDSFATRDVAEDWLGNITTWPWAGLVDLALAGYEIIPTGDGRFDVRIKNPIRPMDWAGAIIEPRDGRYIWTLYCGFTDDNGEKMSYRIESFHYSWPIEHLFSDAVEECAKKIHRAYQEPCPALLKAIEEATEMKNIN